MAEAHNLGEWRGKDVLDRDGDRIGKLEDVYVDTDSDEQLFGTVREGFLTKHLTFVPLRGAGVTPDGLRVSASKEEVKGAPNIDTDGELSTAEEGELYRHYQYEYAPPPTESGRRLARR